MSKSILQSEKECFFCRATVGLEEHHIYFGRNRKVSDENGFTVWLCPKHHRTCDVSVHREHVVDLLLKRLCQAIYEQEHSREDFMKLIGRNYLEEGDDEIYNRQHQRIRRHDAGTSADRCGR